MCPHARLSQDVDVVAATIGPGLAACLEVALRKAKEIVAATGCVCLCGEFELLGLCCAPEDIYGHRGGKWTCVEDYPDDHDMRTHYHDTRRKPFVPINHLEAHALTPRMYDKDLDFPFLILLASGGVYAPATFFAMRAFI